MSTPATSHEEVPKSVPLADGSAPSPKEGVVEVKGNETAGHGNPKGKTGTSIPTPDSNLVVSKPAVTHGSEIDGTFVCTSFTYHLVEFIVEF